MPQKNLVSIVGTGPAGLTAAIYTARAGFAPVVFAGLQHGGQLTTTTDIENFPGFEEGIMGPKLMEQMTKQAERVGAKIIYDVVSRVDFKDGDLRLWVDKEEYHSKTVIIATGAKAKTLGLPHEAQLMGRGISTCATCDGFFYRNKSVIVVGGGDSAMEESLYLANLCKEVHLVHRSETFRASKIMLERAQKHPRIKMHMNTTITEPIFDATGLTGVRLQDVKSSTVRDFPIDGLFYGIGHTPNSEIFKPFVDVDHHGYVKVHESTKTNIPGVFAAGDIADSVFRQAITSAGMGCQAGMQAARYLEENA